MDGRKKSAEKVYHTYKPYPVSIDSKESDYSAGTTDNSGPHLLHEARKDVFEDFSDLVGDPTPPSLSETKPIPSNAEGGLRPLRLLHSLFSERLNFLQQALDELEAAKKERQKLTRYALEELDPEIRECENSLSMLNAVLNDPERRRQLERRLFDLKRDRRRESLLNWRDLVWLRGEIRKLQREIDTFGKTVESAENRDPPK